MSLIIGSIVQSEVLAGSLTAYSVTSESPAIRSFLICRSSASLTPMHSAIDFPILNAQTSSSGTCF